MPKIKEIQFTGQEYKDLIHRLNEKWRKRVEACRQEERERITHRHKLKSIQGTNYCIKRCEICGEMYEKKKKPKNNPKK